VASHNATFQSLGEQWADTTAAGRLYSIDRTMQKLGTAAVHLTMATSYTAQNN
jgi:hypothetical protein